MKKITILVALLVVSSGFSQQIYTNGPLSTGAVSLGGTSAPAGFTWSEVQNNTGSTTESNTNAGFGALFNNAGTNSLQLADDFVVPAGQVWNISSFDFYGYKTGYTGTAVPVDQARIQIFSSDPSVAGAISVAGNMTTNVFDAANSGVTDMYRIFNSFVVIPPATSASAPGTTRKIWRYRGNLAATLPAGTYWVVFQFHDTAETASFFPPVTITGSRGAATANAKQNVVASTATGAVLGWVNVVDGGNPATAPDYNQDFPFLINGTVTTLGISEYDFSSAISISPNPAINTISISNTSGAIISSVEIVDLNGRLIREVSTANISTINVSDLSAGLYLMNIKSDQGITTKKIIKN